MIADNKVYTEIFGISNFIDCFNTAIKDDNEFDTRFLGIVYSFFADSLSFFITIGNIVVYIGIELL